jgi:hypothetical protein
MINNYKSWNTYLGWFVFLIATAVYFITLEDTVSLWDCGEYITAAYKLEVGHPPGAPLFMVLGRLFSFFADPETVAIWINRLSAISSSMTILFMFWTITMFLKKMALKRTNELSNGDAIAIFGGAIVGSLAYTFSDSFWFSAVEGEVYAMSSLFTAVIFWAIMKWDEEMAEKSLTQLNTNSYTDRWLLLIMFLLGLAIGVHLLGILVVPAICFVIYFRYKDTVSSKGIFITGILSIIILAFIQEGVIPGSISLASSIEVMFVNSLGLPFFSGTIFFFGLLTFGCIWTIRYARRNGKKILYNAIMGFILLMIGYGSFAVIVIRSNANTPLDENDPENLVTLHAYLKREQYGSAPLLYGPAWNSKEADGREWKSRSPFYLRRFVVTKGRKDLKAFKNEDAAKKYAAENGGRVEEKYYESNASVKDNAEPTYQQNMFFPRMYWNNDMQQRADGSIDWGAKVEAYKSWSGYNPMEGSKSIKGKDGLRLPSFSENMTYFFSYQVNWMYWRYFMWNFAGRQNDIQGHGNQMKGNWLSGFDIVDNIRLGDQENAPYFTAENPSNNKFFFLPLIFGIIGLLYHFYKSPKDAFVILLAFLFTGLAIVVYLNQKPFEPRERDYAYAGSFYFFAMWIGIGVYALYEAYLKFSKADIKNLVIALGGGLLLFLILDMNSHASLPNTFSWLIISAIIMALVGIMIGLKKVLNSKSSGALAALVLGLFAPVVMGMQGFDDHDRSLKTSADDLAINYLNSCAKNSILFTNGDNDTFPLWYMQEVEGKRTDVRVCNLSLMQTDWYTDQMKMRINSTPEDPNSGSAPLPIKFTEDQILMYAGATDVVYFIDIIDLISNPQISVSDDYMKKVIDLRIASNPTETDTALSQFNQTAMALIDGIQVLKPEYSTKFNELKGYLTTNNGQSKSDNILKKYKAIIEIIQGSGNQMGIYQVDESTGQTLQQMVMEFEKSWSAVDMSSAMAFVRDDKNLITVPGQKKSQNMRIFPTSKFKIPVNAKNAVKSGIIRADQQKMCTDMLQLDFEGVQRLSREEVMMMDVLANNNWERGIYFSSPGGSQLARALYRRGYIKQHGMVFLLSPLNDFSNRFTEEMYDLIMGIQKKDSNGKLIPTYTYGAMSNPDVLTDYYTRRHTSQYRLHFYMLAEDYVKKAELDPSNAASYKEKARKLLLRSLEVMPAEVVIDYGEPSQDSQEEYSLGGQKFRAYSDGILHNYVRLLYVADDKAAAEKLGKTLATQLESIMKYYEKSDVRIISRNDNTSDLYASLDAYFKMNEIALDTKYGNPKGDLAKRTSQYISTMLQKTLPRIINEIKATAKSNGEKTERDSNKAGIFANKMFEMQDMTDAMAVYYGYKEDKAAPQPEMAPMSMPLGTGLGQ